MLCQLSIALTLSIANSCFILSSSFKIGLNLIKKIICFTFPIFCLLTDEILIAHSFMFYIIRFYILLTNPSVICYLEQRICLMYGQFMRIHYFRPISIRLTIPICLKDLQHYYNKQHLSRFSCYF